MIVQELIDIIEKLKKELNRELLIQLMDGKWYKVIPESLCEEIEKVKL